MKRRALERWMRRHQAMFHHHGSSHDVWWTASETSIQFASVPPRAICDQLRIPRPPGL
ncbi:MAG TPA: hypothetical protein VHZ27_11125 [Solirubrobacteraceae bacterium]|nr:hypothetical protein [Solirubrobacteraceae bacterium]